MTWDPDAQRRIEAADLRFRHPVSPYLDRVLYGRVRMTILRGEIVFDGTDGDAAPPLGRVLRGRAAGAGA